RRLGRRFSHLILSVRLAVAVFPRRAQRENCIDQFVLAHPVPAVDAPFARHLGQFFSRMYLQLVPGHAMLLRRGSRGSTAGLPASSVKWPPNVVFGESVRLYTRWRV